MRLINADELKFCNIVKAVIDPMGNPCVKHIDIKDIHTAFDVNKIKDKLKEKGNIQFQNYSKPLITVEDAMKIVENISFIF